jgi:multicomponent Na+:H+ antiporter subunit D
VLIKALGVYAMTRMLFVVFGASLYSLPVGWVLVGLGIVSMVAGAFLAFGQWDLKRLLAYSSISQVGYIILGIGLGGVLLARNQAAWASLAFLGALLHLMNHAVYKSLLFLASGAIQMATGTRDMKQMGGLGARLPVTRTACTIASASIAGIPPFSGFWSKLILVVAAVQAGFYWIGAVIVGVSLCTLIMYLKVHRYVFLGELPAALAGMKENRGTMSLAMVCLAVLCTGMGLLVLVPGLRESILEPAVKVVAGGLDYSTNLIGMR